jgi:hypothetical protein
VTGEAQQEELARIEELPLEDRAEAYRAAQRRLQDRLERPGRQAGD